MDSERQVVNKALSLQAARRSALSHHSKDIQKMAGPTKKNRVVPSLCPSPHPTPYTLHPAPYTLHPTPYTLHPTPYTLHPAPCTLHPTPYTQSGAYSLPSNLELCASFRIGPALSREGVETEGQGGLHSRQLLRCRVSVGGYPSRVCVHCRANMAHIRQSRPDSGLDCLACATFARQRVSCLQMTVATERGVGPGWVCSRR